MAINVNSYRVLLLNSSYEPLGAITIKKAVGLMMRGVAHGVDGIAAKLRTPNTIYEVPSVLRLKYYRNVPHRTVSWSRNKVLRRDNYTCIFCGARPGDKRKGKVLRRSDFTLDHLIPVSKGGRNTWGNTACACYWCNHRKADRTPNEAGMKLLREPKRPRTNYFVLGGEIPSEWRIYVEA